MVHSLAAFALLGVTAALLPVPPQKPEVVHNTAAWSAFIEEDFVTAEREFAAAAEALKRKKDRAGYASALNLLAATQRLNHKHKEAEDNYLAALQIFTEEKIDSGIEFTSNNYAHLLDELGRYREAEDRFLTCWKLLAPGDDRNRTGLLYSLALMYLGAERHGDAEECIRRVMKLHKDPDRGWRMSYSSVIARSYLRNGKLELGKAAMDRAVENGAIRDSETAGLYFLAIGEPKKAEAALAGQLDYYRRGKYHNTLWSAGSLELLAEAKRRNGDADGAAKALAEVEGVYIKAVGPTYWKLARVYDARAKLFPAEAKELTAKAEKVRAANKDNAPRGFDAVFGKMP